MSNDTISRQAAIEALNELSEHYTANGREWHPHINFVIDAIKELSSAEPEIIRCKDCKHYNAGFECLIEGYGIERDKDWYCADAEPKGEQE